MSKEFSVFIYLGSFVISSLFIYLGINKRNVLKGIFTLLGLSIPVVMATFRSLTVGIDTYPYYYLYQTYSSFPTLTEKFKILGFKEYINTLLIHICSKFGGFNLYLFIFSTLTLIVIVIAFYNILPTNDVAICFFLYLCFFFPQLLNIMRQSLAISLVFMSYKYIIDKKPLKFFVIIFLASGVHISALVVIPMYFLINRNEEINYFVFCIFSLLLGLFAIYPAIFFTLVAKIPSFDRYNFYTDYSGDINNRIFYLNLFIFVVIFILRKYLFNKNKYNTFLIIGLFWGLLIGISGFSSPFIKRIGGYFDIVQVVLITELSSVFSSEMQNLMVRYSICLMGILYFIVTSYSLGLARILPYSFQIY